MPFVHSDQPAVVSAAGLLQSPAHAQIAHEPLRKRRYVAKTPNSNLFHVVFLIATGWHCEIDVMPDMETAGVTSLAGFRWAH